MATAEENLRTINDIYAAFFAGDIDGFFEYYDENIEMIEPDSLPYGGHYKGKQAVMNAVRTVMSKWDKMVLDIKTITANDDDYVIALGQFSATGLKTGKFVTYPLAEVWRFRNGKVIFLQPVYGDTKLACEALGA